MLVSALLLFGLLWLIETPATFILFAETILMAAYISALVYDFFRKRSYYSLLLKMTEQMEEKLLLSELLPQPHFLEGQILVDILRRCNKYQKRKQINRTLFTQTAVFFAIPLTVAGIYSAFLIGKAMTVVEEFMNIHISTNIGLTIILFLIVYGSYFLATYLSCKRIVTEQKKLEV